MRELRKASASSPGSIPFLLIVLSLTVYLLVFFGSIALVSSSWLPCPNWPGCLIREELLLRGNWVWEHAHQTMTLISWPLILLSSLFVGWWYRNDRWIARPVVFTIPLIVLQIVMVSAAHPRNWQSHTLAFYAGTVLIVQALMIAATIMAFRSLRAPERAGRLVYFSPYARLTLVSMAALFFAMVTGAAVTMLENVQPCAGWPLCSGSWLPGDLIDWVQIAHWSLVAGVGALMIALVIGAWRGQRFQVAILVWATVVGTLFLMQSVVGAIRVIRSDPAYLIGLHSATSAAVWAAMVVLVIRVGMAARSLAAERVDAFQKYRAIDRAKDFVALTKPVIVLLLLLTTFAGMVIAGGGFPPFRLVFWTLLGGALAAAGSSAVNQYIDRGLDRLMKRTARRPIAAGRITSAEGLAFGVGLCVIAFYLFAVFVNIVAALLALLGMVYYVVIYSLILKQTTDQNIVIGGGAGAIPPLVGWAAVTGGLTIPSLFLFVVIFMWTPPHFWALALVRLKDYRRAGVPMLPVVRGEREARRQIFIYTLILVAITLSLPFFGLGAEIYLASAAGLGTGLIFMAKRVIDAASKKVAWQLYRYSSLYLAMLFIALMVDALI